LFEVDDQRNSKGLEVESLTDSLQKDSKTPVKLLMVDLILIVLGTSILTGRASSVHSVI